MSEMENSKIFKVMKFAAEREQAGKPFTGEELCSELDENWSAMKSYAVRTWGVEGMREGIFEPSSGAVLNGRRDPPGERRLEYRITYSAMMHYLEWVELKEARQSSKRAMYTAAISIGIAIVALTLNLYFARTAATVRLEQSQLSEITSTIENAKPVQQ